MMKRFVLAALAATTLAGPVLAQDFHRDRQELHNDRHELRNDRQELRGDRRELRQDVRDGDHREFRRDAREFERDRRDFRGDRRDFRGDRRDWRDDRHDDRRDWRWDRDRFHGGGYAYPRGYGYRSWGVGINLAPVYFGQRYWINDYGRYQLGAPAYGTRWVRVGPDALLIRIRDGFILRAVRGLYY